MLVFNCSGLFIREILGHFADNAAIIDFQFDFDRLAVLRSQYITVVFEKFVEVVVCQISIQLFQPHVTFRVRVAAFGTELRKLSLRLVQSVKIKKRDISTVHFIR